MVKDAAIRIPEILVLQLQNLFAEHCMDTLCSVDNLRYLEVYGNAAEDHGILKGYSFAKLQKCNAPPRGISKSLL